MPTPISDLTLEDLLQELIVGRAVVISGNGETFQLDSSDSRAALAFYARHRDYWRPERNITEREVEELLQSLDQVPVAVPTRVTPASQRRLWHLRKVEAHRFGGLHRHCGTDGEDPPLFEQDIAADVTLIRGFNGAGKSSLLSAIAWCLTGRAFRSQRLPAEIHHPVTLERGAAEHSEDEGAEGTNTDEEVADTFELPPIVPMPSDTELAALEDEPKHDTWVRLTFEPENGSEAVTITRTLVRRSNGRFETEVEGLDSLGLSDLALQIGTVMPGIAAAMRFDERTELSEAVESLTGLNPMSLFGKRCRRFAKRLRETEVRRTEERMDEVKAQFGTQRSALQDVVRDHPELPQSESIALPGEEVEGKACNDTLAAAKSLVESIEAQAQGDITSILGKTPQLDDANAVRILHEQINAADEHLRGGALSALPSMRNALAIKALSVQELDRAETLISSVAGEGEELAAILDEKEKAERWQLYARVAHWHEANHPGQDIETCPVCTTDLDEVPKDAVLDLRVKEALERCRRTDEYVAKTAAEWERDQARTFVSSLPEALRPFVDRNLPETLTSYYECALTGELFNKTEFQGMLRPLKVNAAAIWEEASRTLPPPDVQTPPCVPAVFPDDHGLRKKLNTIKMIIDMARYRLAHEGQIEQVMQRMIGTSVAVRNGDKEDKEDDTPAARLPLRQQLARLKRFAETVNPIVAAKRQLGELQSVNNKWLKQQERVGLLARAACAIEDFLRFPDLVHSQVTGLLTELDADATAWFERIYSRHYFGAPEYAGLSRKESETLGMRASMGRVSFPAHEVMNASALRTFLWSFLLALWSRIRFRSGGLSCVLMDDPQTLFDPANIDNLASSIPRMIGTGVHPVITSDNFSFIGAVQRYVRSGDSAAASQECFDISPISCSKLVTTLLPVADEIHERREVWKEDENNSQKAQVYVEPVRIRIETKLWDLLGSDPVTLHDPALGDLLDKLRSFRNTGQPAFTGPPFQRLLDHRALRADHGFYKIINKAHHSRSRDITPTEAGVVDCYFNEIDECIEACTIAYARFMRRLPPDQTTEVDSALSSPPASVSLEIPDLPILGRLAARMGASPIETPEAATEMFVRSELGNVALFRVRASTLGLACLQGQTAIVSLDSELARGDLVIAQYRDTVFARRLGTDPGDPAKVALECIPLASSNVPPTHFLPRRALRLLKIVGVLFDNERALGPGEAVSVTTSPILRQVQGLADVVDDSAFPVAKGGDRVLIKAVDLLPNLSDALADLTGRIVAVVTRSPKSGLEERQGFLKRLGPAFPGVEKVRYLENVGQIGEGEYVQFGDETDRRFPDVPVVDVNGLWRVHGVLYR